MNIVFRLLVALTLVINGIALWFAKELDAKRTLLLDGNEALRNFVGEIARTFETEEPAEDTASYEERDVTEVSLATADITPDKGDFWSQYKPAYEEIPTTSMKVDTELLKEVYVLDAEGKPLLDGRGNPLMDGAPLSVKLADVLKAAKDQKNRLNKTREFLPLLRKELEDVIAEINRVKVDARQSLKTIAERDATISTLEGEKAALQDEVAAKEGEIESLNAEKEAMQADLDKAVEDLDTAKAEIEKLRRVIKESIQSGSNGEAGTVATGVNVVAGVKGKVVAVNNKYNYCIIQLTDEAYTEIFGEEGNRVLPKLEFYVKSEGVDIDNGYKAIIRLQTLVKLPKAVYCEIPVEGKLKDVAVGDEVFYLN